VTSAVSVRFAPGPRAAVIDAAAGGQSLVSNLVVEGSQTQVRVPSGLLQAGTVYALTIVAIQEPNTPPCS